MLARWRWVQFGCAVMVLGLAGSVSATTLPTPPPSTDFGSYGKLRVQDRLAEPSEAPEIWASHVAIRKAKGGKLVVEPTVPFVGTFARGRYRLTGYWEKCNGGFCGPPSDYCSRTIDLNRGDRNKVTIVRRVDEPCKILVKDSKIDSKN
jgi:hypothetical protein